ncbi:hypothetical protein, partial [Dialister succinatiphilus]|uniref:hypothetical protein n=1 Tax=Dialister succinatiphilus TaxID=487173 RepID=UPI003F7FA0B2
FGAIFYTAFGGENHTTALRARKCIPPLVAGATTLPGGKHVTGFAGRLQLPYESSSFATLAVRWGGKRKAP